MSDPTYTNTDRAPALSTGGHDSGLYDPNQHDNRIVAVYETTERASAARDMLIKAGVPAGAIEMLDQSQMAPTTPAGDATDHGIWGSLKSLFVPDEDAYGYAEGVRRGHAVLSVDPTSATDRHHVIEVLESTDPIDFDARLEEWRQAGYSYPNSSAVGAASGMITPAPAPASKVSAVDMPVAPAPVAPAAVAAPMASTTATTARTETARTDGAASMAVPAMGAPGDADVIKVMEERLRVGKREVARGAVRVRSYLVERPVEEQVSLHDERVTLERHAVDRPASAAEMAAFGERTIEVRATGEEAVVSKEARIVEEIGIHKEASDRVETVRDTVRRTEVEVEDTTNKTVTDKPGTEKVVTPTPAAGGTQAGGKTTTSTAGATSSGMNAPRK